MSFDSGEEDENAKDTSLSLLVLALLIYYVNVFGVLMERC